MRAADQIVDVLVQAGVDTVFGMPGGTIAPLFDALIDRPQIRVVTTRHEGTAMFAAAGYARATGRPGIVLVTSGPGVINTFTGLASAYCEGLPILVLAGEVQRGLMGRGALQDGSAYALDILSMARPVTKLAIEIHEPHNAVAVMRHAVVTACAPRPGPVLLTLPTDVTTASSGPTSVVQAEVPMLAVEPEAVHQTALWLAGAERVLIFAGSGMRADQGPKRLRELAERTQYPVMTTPKGKGVFPEDHPLHLGVFGLGGHPSANAWLTQGIDVLLALGTSMSDVATSGWSHLLSPRQAFVHVDLLAQHIGRAYPVTLGVVAPAASFLEQLIPQLPRRDVSRRYGVRYHTEPAAVMPPLRSMPPQRALWELQQVLPGNTIYTCDSGEHFLFAVHYLKIVHPDSFIAMSGLGSMGSGIGAALGVQLAHRERTVVAVCGDGGFAMLAADVSTAVCERLPIIFAVMNDQRLGMVERGNTAVFGRTPRYPTTPMDIGRLGGALGAHVYPVNQPEDILAIAPLLQGNVVPIVLDVHIDPRAEMPKSGRISALASGPRRTKKRIY